MIKQFQCHFFLLVFLCSLSIILCDTIVEKDAVYDGILTDSIFVDIDSLSTVSTEHSIPIQNVPSFGFMMFQMIGMLIFLAIMLYAALYFFKKINAKFKNKTSSTSFTIHENVYFNTKQGLSAVSFGNKIYIIGFSQNTICLIDMIDDAEIVSSFKIANNSKQSNFPDLLKAFFTKNRR